VVRELRANQSTNGSQLSFGQVGRFTSHDRFTVRCAKHGRILDASLEALKAARLKPLDW